jgi:hypothetical protein
MGAANVLPCPDPAASGQYTGNTVRCGQTCLTVSVRCDVLGYRVQASREVHQEKQTGKMMTLHFKTVSTISIMTLAIVGMFFAPEARACGVRPASGRGKCLESLGTGIRQSLQDETHRLELRHNRGNPHCAAECGFDCRLDADDRGDGSRHPRAEGPSCRRRTWRRRRYGRHVLNETAVVTAKRPPAWAAFVLMGYWTESTLTPSWEVLLSM